MSELDPTLTRLGDALERAATATLPGGGPARRRATPRRLAFAFVALAIVIPGVAIGADALISGESVSQSMPAGAVILAGTKPTCTVVEADVEFHCVLTNPPAAEATDAAGNPLYKGTVEPTVDATTHVNGGCRALTTDGLEWQCYVGEAAVEQQIIGPDFLGEPVTGPGVG